jgi:squalene-hopene/tetraprenyl-beta-curcumene cyclase
MVAYLRLQQFTEQNGWRPQDPAYGAWGMGGDRRTPPDTGHVDLSMTRYVLDALRAAGVADSAAEFASARVFVERCQNFDPHRPADADGGFFFSTTEADTNKAGQDRNHFRSYGTTTADGILALLATGHPLTDQRVIAAKGWLSAHHRDIEVPGFVGEAYQRWPRGLVFYYSATSLKAFQALKVDASSGVLEGLRRTQRVDGSWANAENLVKEDDPLIATPFAVRALATADGRR